MKQLPILLVSLIALTLAACSSTPIAPAPVVERTINRAPVVPTVGATRPTVPAATSVIVAPTKPVVAPAIDGKSYVVKKGDTLYGIALENGLSYRDIAQWNDITNIGLIQIDQVLRLSAPAASITSSPSPATIAPATTQAAPAPSPALSPVASPVVAPGASAVVNSAPVVVVATTPVAAPMPVATPAALPGDVVWQWPVKGKISQGFVDGKSKGLDIAGKTGDAIAAAADGKVVYAGAALKGYGQLLIVKHSDVYLTAYAHNSKLLVKEDQVVKRGQKIAEMGNTESDDGQTKLHFELRRSGKPVDPVKLLPAQ